MNFPRFFLPSGLAPGARAALEGGEHHHLARVLRMKTGDGVILFDGRGLALAAEILEIGRDATRLQTGGEALPANESPLRTILIQALGKADKTDFVVEKAVEMGVHEIFPVFTARCDVKPAGGTDKKTERWRSIALAACKQCGRAVLPAVHAPGALEAALASAQAERKFLLHPGAPSLKNGAAPRSAAMAVGPEGGFTDEEISLAARHGFEPLALGPRVLRTETAALAALAVLQNRWGDWKRHEKTP
jgi:16S rRNA (uracil1498-N3)-methyltransferase